MARPAPERFTHDGVTTAYWQIPAKNPAAGRAPIYFLHGGPGFDHKYVED